MNRRLQRNVICCYVAFFATAHTPARSADWPQFRGDRPHTAAAAAPDSHLLVPVWSRRLPAVTIGSTTYQPGITSSPAIVDGIVYVGSRNTRFYALSADSGAILWEHQAGREIESSPLVTDSAVFFAPYNGNLTALNLADGSVRWIHNSGGVQDRSSPNRSGDNIVSAASFPKTTIYAVPLNSPNPAPEAWSVPTGQFVYASPAVDPATENIFCPSDDGKIYALKPDGSPLWPQPFATIGGVFRASPTVGNGKVYLSAGDYDWALHAVDAATGALVWNAPMVPTPDYPAGTYRAIQVSSPAVDGDFVTVVGGYGNNLGDSILYAFKDNGPTVDTLWTARIPNNVSEGYVSSPAITPTSVLVGAAAKADAANPILPRGRVYVVERATGAPAWYASGDAQNTGGPILSSPSVSNGLVVVGDTSGLLTAYRMVPAGDVDADNRVTALDALKMLAASGTDGQATADVRYRGDIHPADTLPPDAARSFGNGLVTPADADLVLQYALGLKMRLPEGQ